jgi:hypothetical protein
MNFNLKYLPKPVISDQCSGEFHIPVGFRIVYESNFVNFSSVSLCSFDSFHKLLEDEIILLVLADRDKQWHSIYLEHLHAMDAAIQQDKAIKTFHRDKVGEEVLFAYDEAKRMLTVCASEKVSLSH